MSLKVPSTCKIFQFLCIICLICVNKVFFLSQDIVKKQHKLNSAKRSFKSISILSDCFSLVPAEDRSGNCVSDESVNSSACMLTCVQTVCEGEREWER